MKKQLLALMALGFSGTSLLGYTHTIYNTTPGKIAVKLNLISSNDVNKVLEPNTEMKIGTGIRLMRAIEVRGLSGPIAGMKAVQNVTGSKARGRQFFINYVGYEVLNASQQGGININIGGSQLYIKPGTGRLEVEQR